MGTRSDIAPDELESFLASVGREGSYRVDRLIKKAPSETTETVYFTGSNGAELGPFIRKRLVLADGIGRGYEMLFDAQRRGARFVHLPRLLECRREGDELVVVMECVQGETLESMVADCGPSPELALRVMPSVCEAVSELHAAFHPPLIHRDLKPSNIIMSGDVPVLIDFGIARSYRADARTDTVRFGTRGYAAPEQFGFGQTSVRSDVYALGALLYFCCTGAHPTGAISADDLAEAGIPRALSDVILRASAFDPAARYPDAGEMRVDLLAADIGENPKAQTDIKARENSVGMADRIVFDHSEAVPQERRIPHPVKKTSGPPAVLGRIWNGLLALVAVLLIPSCCSTVIHPTGVNVDNPLWYNLVMSVLLVYPICAIFLLLIADRRRWRRVVPFVGKLTTRNIFLAAVKVLAVCFAVVLLLSFYK